MRAVAAGEELAYLGDVHQALCKLSQQALLIAIVGGQERKTLTVQSNYSVLVQRLGFKRAGLQGCVTCYKGAFDVLSRVFDRLEKGVSRRLHVACRFIEEDPIQTTKLASYADAVRRSLDWAVGREMKARIYIYVYRLLIRKYTYKYTNMNES